MAEWSAEVVVDEALARRLVSAQVPEVDCTSFQLLGEGWDNTVWLADERWVFRFPRRAIAVPGITRQLSLLPRLAPLLPLRIPEPVFLGRPSDGFPWPFSGHERLAGSEAAEAPATDGERTGWARPLGEFLRALHDPRLLELEGVAELPVDPNGRADMDRRCAMLRSRLAELAELELWEAPAIVDELLLAAERLPRPSTLALAHGDLHLRHVLVEDGRPSAVIDWDDVCRADPAIDLVPYWSLLSPAARAGFLGAYGAVSEEQLLRARVLSVFLSGTLAVYGRREGMPRLEREALACLDRSVAG